MSKVLGGLLKSYRLDSDISQELVAKKLGYGSGQIVSNWERGVIEPPIGSVKKLARLYGVPALNLFDDVVRSKIESLVARADRQFKRSK